MLVSRLLRALLRFLSPGIVPEDGGAPVADLTPPTDPAAVADPGAAPAADPAAAPAAAAPADPLAGLRDALDGIGRPEGAQTGGHGQPRDAMGRFLPVDPNAPPAAAAPVAPAAPVQAPAAKAPAAAVPPAPKPGDLDLTPPEGMNERSQQRWAQLTERVKQVPELERRATEATQALDSVRQLVNDAGLAPQEFTEMLDMARLYKSTNPQDAQRALQMLDGLRSELATRFGLEAPGVDALSAHPDLKQKVDGMLLSREDALEIARLRQQGQQAQQVTTQQQEQQQHVQAVQSAAAKLETVLAARAATPGHAEKVAYIAKHFQNPENLQRFVKTYRPHQWEGVVLAMYEAFTPQPTPPVPNPQPPTPQPMRPSGMRPGAPVQTGPVTAQSAIEAGLAAAGL